MKKVHLIGIVMIIIGIFALTSVSKDMGTYASFADAIQSKHKVRVVGELAKDKAMVYEPEIDPNKFSFYIKDRDGVEKKVILLDAKPQDFEMSEQIVVTGKMHGDEFVASDILLKCPSKYKDEELKLKEAI